MYTLPLFPLHSVLFPGIPLHLHIFEERYKRLVRDCLDENQAFGVVFIRRGREVFDPQVEVHPVGCSARILHSQPLGEGRMNLVAVGMERFRLLELDRESQPYLLGRVQAFPLEIGDAEVFEKGAHSLRPQVERFLKAVVDAGGGELELPGLPSDPLGLAYMAAAMLQVPLDEKQALLSMVGADELLTGLQVLYRRELALLSALLQKREERELIPFSRN